MTTHSKNKRYIYILSVGKDGECQFSGGKLVFLMSFVIKIQLKIGFLRCLFIKYFVFALQTKRKVWLFILWLPFFLL